MYSVLIGPGTAGVLAKLNSVSCLLILVLAFYKMLFFLFRSTFFGFAVKAERLSWFNFFGNHVL